MGGRKGVGPGRGRMLQPLQEENRIANRIAGMNFFIFFSSVVIVSRLGREAKPPVYVRKRLPGLFQFVHQSLKFGRVANGIKIIIGLYDFQIIFI